MQLLVEIIDNIRELAAGAVIGVRLSAIESLLSLDDVQWVMSQLQERADIDYFNLAVGDRGNYVKDMGVDSPPLLPLAAQLAAMTTLPLLLSQSFRTAVDINAALASGADLVGMCRALIADPDAPKKMLAGRSREIRPCTACNEDCRLFDPCLLCSVNPDLAPPGHRRRPAAPIVVQLSSRPSGTVAVVGGGPAGLEATLTLARAGRPVTLYEATGTLGGQLSLAGSAPYRSGWSRLIDFYRMSLTELKVDVRLRHRAAGADIDGVGDVIVAIGADESLPAYGAAVGATTCSQTLAAGSKGLSASRTSWWSMTASAGGPWSAPSSWRCSPVFAGSRCWHRAAPSRWAFPQTHERNCCPDSRTGPSMFAVSCFRSHYRTVASLCATC